MEQTRIKTSLKENAVKNAFANSGIYELIADPIVLNTESALEQILDDPQLPIQEKSKAVYDNTCNIINELFESEITPEKIHEAKSSINAMLSGVISNKITITSLIKVSNYDYYTYTHCVNVAVYSIGLAKELGMSNKELELIGAGGILHDLGKSRVDIGIVNKPGKLTESEFTEMKNHPIYGYEILQEQHETDEVILTCVRHHHEKVNGAGYPDRIKDQDLSVYARIVAICDIFDALSTKRSYKPALSTFETLNMMNTKLKDELDSKLLKVFIRMMGRCE
ncbi:MAG: HD-GYP domain-containing protein [Helicobacteraceae bacterium]|jgi:putative nucleotidyltransferase with HDIG domain|nr:HD-GYP domain-containing protein [Helicobacteraceae bacterium]